MNHGYIVLILGSNLHKLVYDLYPRRYTCIINISILYDMSMIRMKDPTI